MTDRTDDHQDRRDRAPGDDEQQSVAASVRGYLIGFALAAGLTIASFWVASGGAPLWTPGIPVMLGVLAVAQMGVHLAFFLHISTGPDSTNNVLALAFGVLIVALVVGGSLWIMANLNANMMSPEMMARMRAG